MMIRLVEKGTTLTWGPGLSSDPESEAIAAPTSVAVVVVAAVAVAVAIAAAVSTSTSRMGAAERDGVAIKKLSRLFKSVLGFEVDNSTFTEAQIRAMFYPKFKNDKSDQKTRTKMIDMVSHGLANLKVTLKHSSSLFMYDGHHGGAYVKNSFGNSVIFFIPAVARCGGAWDQHQLAEEEDVDPLPEDILHQIHAHMPM
ncbi:tRNA ligase 1 [Zea mays]|uniref:tRNA ligase 1 n=1 Tax=Zea mays TaxID=4577 RepID=UPI0004DEAEC1|nr:tRNA ligase 1-like [Zea mays]|eukprot:XP_008671499.1 tRNA ligase 1-like [Zea mays]